MWCVYLHFYLKYTWTSHKRIEELKRGKKEKVDKRKGMENMKSKTGMEKEKEKDREMVKEVIER